jgi:hypothetical protein
MGAYEDRRSGIAVPTLSRKQEAMDKVPELL